LPEPEAPFVIESQVAPSLVVQAHPAGVVTEMVLLEAAGPTEATEGETEYVHGAPAWVTVSVWFAIVTVPVRLVVAAFAATL
jgi:hypothetical protein